MGDDHCNSISDKKKPHAAGFTPNPSYQEVCSGMTGHNEVVLVVFDPEKIKIENLLKIFWEAHDPTQCMGQGNDKGTQYAHAYMFLMRRN